MDPSLPGADLVEQGLEDLRRGVESVPALLVAMASGRLRDLGFAVARDVPDAHLKLYELLAAELGDGAHSRFNALQRQLVSFIRAQACAR